MPGHDWIGMVLEPIYIACRKNQQVVAMFFGIIVFKLFMESQETWGFGKHEKDGRYIGA